MDKTWTVTYKSLGKIEMPALYNTACRQIVMFLILFCNYVSTVYDETVLDAYLKRGLQAASPIARQNKKNAMGRDRGLSDRGKNIEWEMRRFTERFTERIRGRIHTLDINDITPELGFKKYKKEIVRTWING
jgi:hypothetical protein